MRSELENIEHIENYLLGKLSDADKQSFKDEIKSDPALAQEVESQRTIMNRLKVIALKREIKSTHERNVGTNRSFLSGKGFYLLLSIAAIVLITFSYTTWINNNTSDIESSTTAYINPPLPSADVPFIVKTINADSGNTLFYESGSMVHIPAASLVDKNGDLVKGEVEIQFREFSDNIDLFLSGIPMDYSIGDKTYPFESAAMSEIYATQKGEQLDIKKGVEIEIVQSSYTTSDAFNLYQFNKESGEWAEKGKDNPIDLNEENVPIGDALVDDSLGITEATEAEYYTEMADSTASFGFADELETANNIKPKKANPNKKSFSINYEKKEFPELAGFDNVLFEIDDKKSNFKEGDDQIEWEDVSIEKGNSSGTYKVHFTKKTVSIKRTYAVIPVFEGANYSNALNLYNKKLSAYNQKRKQRKSNEAIEQAQLALQNQEQLRRNRAAERRNKYIDSMNVTIEQRNAYIAAINKKTEERNANIIAQRRVADSLRRQRIIAFYGSQAKYDSVQKVNSLNNDLRRAYKIDGFGIWNCDQPMNSPYTVQLAGIFKYNSHSVNRITVTDKSIRSLISYYISPNQPVQRFRYNSKSRNVVWTVSGEIILYFNDFESIPKGSREFTFNMKKLDVPATNYKEVKNALSKL